MLKPDKHTNPVLSVINIAGLIIEQIRNDEIVNYDDLLSNLVNQTSESVKDIFLYSLSFLYLLDKIEYIPNLDALKLKT
ncbi:MAG: hypothetical protein IMY69_00280 [Bacteroidetes bacterium]|nr:hypothetical protein [Bacteroidota bacterium]